MKLSCSLANFSWDGGVAGIAPRISEISTIADEAGFGSLAAMDHWFQIEQVGPPEKEMLEGYSVLSFMAAKTRNVNLQLLVTGVTYRHPGLLAKIVTTLDVLSEGRATLGIGAAWFEAEHEGLGVPYPSVSERFERLDETLAIYRQMCSPDESPFMGTHFQLARTLNSPAPLQNPYPPVMIGGMGPTKTLRLAARYANSVNWFPIGVPAFEGLKATLAKHCETEGTDVDQIRLTMMAFHPDCTDAAAVDSFVADMAEYAALGVAEVFVSPAGPDPVTQVAQMGEVLVPKLAELG